MALIRPSQSSAERSVWTLHTVAGGVINAPDKSKPTAPG
jgi:hypothetical protein